MDPFQSKMYVHMFVWIQKKGQLKAVDVCGMELI